MKKILIVLSGLKIGGGAEKSATMVGNALFDKGYDIHYLTFYDAKEKYEFKGVEQCLHERFSKNILVNFFKLFWRALAIRNYCCKHNIDVCISHMEEANFPNILSQFFLNKAQIDIVIHNSVAANSDLYKFLIKLLYKFADKVVTVSKEIKYQLETQYNLQPSGIYPIYNAVDLSDIKEKSQEDLGEYHSLFNNGKFTFINIGRLTKQKNHKMLLNAFNKFHKRNSNSQLIVIGDGELKDTLQAEQKNLSASQDIYFLGVQNNPYKFLMNSDVFVLSSDWEGFGIVLIEAMACKLPIISTACTAGPKEILRKKIKDFSSVQELSYEDYGILLPVGNEDYLAKAMKSLYFDEGRLNNYRERGLKRVKHFSMSNIIKKRFKVL